MREKTTLITLNKVNANVYKYKLIELWNKGDKEKESATEYCQTSHSIYTLYWLTYICTNIS